MFFFCGSQNTKITSLERIIRELESELTALKQMEELTKVERGEESKQLEVFMSHSNFMKNKVLSRRAKITVFVVVSVRPSVCLCVSVVNCLCLSDLYNPEKKVVHFRAIIRD